MSEALRRLYAQHSKARIAALVVFIPAATAVMLQADASDGADITAVRIVSQALPFVAVAIPGMAASLWAPTPWSTVRGSVLVGSGLGTLYTLSLLLQGGPLLPRVLFGLIMGLMYAGLFAWETQKLRRQQRTVAPGDARDTPPPRLQV